MNQQVQIPLTDIKPSKTNPRKHFDQARLDAARAGARQRGRELMRNLSPIQEHERSCVLCRARQWCPTVMDMMARRDEYLTYDLKLAATAHLRTGPPRVGLMRGKG